MTSETEDPAPVPPRKRRLRRVFLWLLGGMLALCLALVLVVALMPAGRIIALPEWAKSRIEARIDAGMLGGDIRVAEIGIGRSEGSRRPRIVLRDVALLEDGAPRLVLPSVAVEIDGRSALGGQFRPQAVQLDGAELTLVLDENGRLSLMAPTEDAAPARDLAQTLAGIDRMFDDPVFSQLEEVRGQGLRLYIDNLVSGDQFEVQDTSVTLTPSDADVRLTIEGRFENDPDAALGLTLIRRAEASETEIITRIENLPAADIATTTEALAWLGLVNAPLSGEMRTVFFDDMSVGHLTGALQVGQGVVNTGGGVLPQPLDHLSLIFDYDAETARLWIEELDVASPVFSARITGHADILDGPSYLTQLRLSDLTANPTGLFADPLQFEGGALDMRLQLEPVVALDIGQAVLFDPGLHLQLRGRVAAEEGGLALRLDAEVPELAARRVLPFWPVERVPNTRRWLDQNLLEGVAQNVHAALRLNPGVAPQFGVTFDFDQARVRALRAMSPVEDGRGYVNFADNVFTLVLHEGQVIAPDGGALDLAGSVMRLDDTRIRTPEARFDLDITGPISSALTLIAAEPFHLLEDFPQNPATVAQGQADLDVALDFTMRPRVLPPDVTFEITGQLLNVTSDELVEGRRLAANRLQVAADPQQLSIGGPARLDVLRANATWSRALGPGSSPDSDVTGTAEITQAALAEFGVTLPANMVQGSGAAEFDLELSPGRAPVLNVSSDLDGLRLAVPQLGWVLPTNSRGALQARIVLGPQPSVPELSLTGNGLEMDGSVSLTNSGRLDRLRFDRLQVGNWLDVSGALVGRPGGAAPEIQIESGQADIRGLPQSGGGGGGGSSAPLDLALNRLTVADGITLTNLRAQLSGAPLSGEFRGGLGGATLAGVLVMEANGPSIRLRSNDGGAVLRGADIYPNAYGGELELILRPQPGEGRFNGLMTIDNPRLRDAPALADLLNLISVVGLLEQLASGEGVALGDVRMSFQLAPDRITILEGTAVGPAMGLSLQGTHDTARNYVDFEGVISPLYVVNGLIGGLFTPRREGLFGFTYQLTGPPGNTQVSVNPFSVLTPGIFREIFRSPPPEPQ